MNVVTPNDCHELLAAFGIPDPSTIISATFRIGVDEIATWTIERFVKNDELDVPTLEHYAVTRLDCGEAKDG